MADDAPNLSCPSAQPDMEEARVFGVIAGTQAEPRVAYLKRKAEVTPEMTAGLGDLDPTQVFRFSARCETGRCAQFENGRCSLAHRIVQNLARQVTISTVHEAALALHSIEERLAATLLSFLQAYGEKQSDGRVPRPSLPAAVVALGEVEHESVDEAVLIRGGLGVPASDIGVPHPGFARAQQRFKASMSYAVRKCPAPLLRSVL